MLFIVHPFVPCFLFVGYCNNARHLQAHYWCQGETTSHSEGIGACSLPEEERKVNLHFTSLGGGYIGFKCHKTLRWQALWDVIKRKYDWGAVEQWWRCLWDGLWLCQELAAKSIDPDAIAVCTTNTRAFMYLSCLEAVENLSKPTHGFTRIKCLFICSSSHPLIFWSLDSVRTFWPKQLVTRSFSS